MYGIDVDDVVAANMAELLWFYTMADLFDGRLCLFCAYDVNFSNLSPLPHISLYTHST